MSAEMWLLRKETITQGPEIQDLPADLSGYDTLFIGYPNWNADLPMPLYTFLEEYDLSGKTIIPFTTHGGSGFSRTIDTIAELEPDAQVEEDGLAISRMRCRMRKGK